MYALFIVKIKSMPGAKPLASKHMNNFIFVQILFEIFISVQMSVIWISQLIVHNFSMIYKTS